LADDARPCTKKPVSRRDAAGKSLRKERLKKLQPACDAVLPVFQPRRRAGQYAKEEEKKM